MEYIFRSHETTARIYRQYINIIVKQFYFIFYRSYITGGTTIASSYELAKNTAA